MAAEEEESETRPYNNIENENKTADNILINAKSDENIDTLPGDGMVEIDLERQNDKVQPNSGTIKLNDDSIMTEEEEQEKTNQEIDNNNSDDKNDVNDKTQNEEVVPSEETIRDNSVNENETNEERFRVDRKQLENLLKDKQGGTSSGSIFFEKIEKATNTTISWPAKLKIGAKTRKDPFIKVTGQPEDRQAAKLMVLSIMDTKSSRVTLKMDVSFADHSHIIGKGGNTIKKVMKDTQCHIHFPDSNRTSSEKSNQVSIAGPPFCVESARRQIRELLPIVLKFEIPQAVTVPDSSSPIISSIGHKLSVNITFQQQLRSYNYIGCVKGLHSDPFSVRDAVLKVLEHLTGTVPVTVPVTTQVEIDAKHHVYVVGHNGANIRNIQQATGASIHFPDPNDPNTRKSTVTITGTIESAVTAKVYLLQYLPLILMFDVRDGENDHLLEQNVLNHLMATYDVQITVKQKPRQCCKSIIVKGHEKNALNIYKARMHLIGEDPANMPHLFNPLATLVISPQVNTQMQLYNGMGPGPHQHVSPGNLSKVTVDTSSQPSNNQLGSPPIQSSSPQERSQSPPSGSNRYMSVSPVGQKIVGIEMKIKKMSLDGSKNNLNDTEGSDGSSREYLSTSKSTESLLDALRQNKENQTSSTKELESLALSGSWNRQNANRPTMSSVQTSSLVAETRLSRSQDDLENSTNLSLTANLINNVALQANPKFNVDDYEARKKKAKNAMQSSVKLGKVRTPTDAWSGFGFSNSMPEAAIKELWNNRERKNNKSPLAINGHHLARNNHLHNIQQQKPLSSPTTSLDSSVSSNGSATSAHSHGMGHQSPPSVKPIRRPGPPPGLGDSRSSVDNIVMMNRCESDYASMLSPPEPQLNVNNGYANVKGLADLFTMLGLDQYITPFEKEEVDLQTFMTLNEDELKELGVSTFGARKKMVIAMKELHYLHNQPTWNHHNNNGISSATSLPSSMNNGYYRQQQPSVHPFDIAAHSLRW